MTSYQDALVLFALLFRFDNKLFYPFVLRTISMFNRYAYCVVARLVVNIQHSTGCLIVCFPGMTSLLPKVCALSDVFFLKIFLFFDLPQHSNRFDYIRDRRRSTYFNNQNKNSSGDEIANVNFCTTTTYMERPAPTPIEPLLSTINIYGT